MLDRVFSRIQTTHRPAWVDHRSVSLMSLGETVPRAVVASEDARFFLHHGFDWAGICGAAAKNADGRSLRGGSSITQQTAKNVFLWQGRSWLRKGLEAWYTLLMEAILPKERILELYLSVAETGPMTFGVHSGATLWFQSSPAALTPDQAARLAGIFPSPNRWDPSGESATKRARHVAANPAPFPGDRGFNAAAQAYAAQGRSPLCLFDLLRTGR